MLVTSLSDVNLLQPDRKRIRASQWLEPGHINICEVDYAKNCVYGYFLSYSPLIQYGFGFPSSPLNTSQSLHSFPSLSRRP